MSWLHSLNRRKHQHRMNQYMRLMNKNLENDDLWRGRFYVRQIGSPEFYVYEDKSGASLFVHLRCYDRLTGDYVDGWDDVNSWCHFNGSKLWRFVNDAIVEKMNVWRTDDLDPRKIKNDPKYDYRRKSK